MSTLFRDKNYDQDIGSGTFHVTTMNQMFLGIPINQNIDAWNTSNVTNMQEMFKNADSFSSPVGSWDVSSVTTMWEMFFSIIPFNQDIGAWDVSSVTDMLECLIAHETSIRILGHGMFQRNRNG